MCLRRYLQFLETFLVVTTMGVCGEAVLNWCLVGRGQGCWPTSYRAWCSPLQQRILWLKMSGVLGLRNYALAKWVTRSCLLSWQAASLRHLFSLSVKYPLWPSHKDVGKNYKNNGWKAWSAVQVITIVKMWFFFLKLKYSWFTVLYQSLLCCIDSIIHTQTFKIFISIMVY